MTESISPARPATRRRWLLLASAGVAFVILAMIAVALLLYDKPHFGWMMGPAFLGIIASGVIVGGAMVLVAALMLPERWTWRGIVLIAWGLIAAASPIFGYLFLAPWALLAVLLPVVIVILNRLYRT